MPKNYEQLLETYGNLLNLKKCEIFEIQKNLLQKKEEERRTKQSLDSPQTIEANNKLKKVSDLPMVNFLLQNTQVTPCVRSL